MSCSCFRKWKAISKKSNVFYLENIMNSSSNNGSNSKLIRNSLYFTGAAGSTAIADILHLVLVTMAIKFNFLFAIFFTIIGILQIFWAIPTIKRWSKFWDYVGIAGTSILLILWAITRIPEFTGSGFPFNDFDFATIWFEGEYLGTVLIGMKLEKNVSLSQF
jgi:hypothetical protein